MAQLLYWDRTEFVILNSAAKLEYDNSQSTLESETIQTAIDELDFKKVDEQLGKGLSTEDYTTAEKNKLALIQEGATNYQHPINHPASIITQDSNNRFMTDAERTKLSGIATGANNYTHPATHSISEVSGLQTALDGKVDDSQVLTNVPAGAVFTDTVYNHPTTSGNKHIPSGGTSNQYLKYSADGTAVWASLANNLTTTTGGTPLDATQGKVLNDIVSSMNLIFTNKAVATTDFVADTTYTDYGYKAVIPCAGVTVDYRPDVTFNVPEAVSGNYAPVVSSGAGTVTIYAKVVPGAAITIPTITCIKAVV